MRRTGRRVLLGMQVVALGLVVSAARCPGKKTPAKPAAGVAAGIPDSADQVVFGQRTVLTDQGVAKGVLLSDSALVYDDGTRIEFKRVNFTFFTPQGAKDGLMTSRTAVYSSRLSRLEARGDVVVTRDDGKRLTSQQLVYDQARNQIFTDSAFVLIEPDRQLSGIGFESDPRLTNFNCLRACKAIASVNIPRN